MDIKSNRVRIIRIGYLILFFCFADSLAPRLAAADPISDGIAGLGSRMPKFVVSGALDQRGNLWIGSESDGVWRVGVDGTRQFTVNDGLGDNDAYAMAVDHAGRIWVGHSSHGVSVYADQQWRNYSVLRGPGGSHVFAIAICPTDGDVWIATEAGLTRYSESSDSWTYFDRSTGMPDDEAGSIAFDAEGNLYAGLLCGGVTIAQAADNYHAWKSVTGPDDMPVTPTGTGLPGPLVNAMLVSNSGIVFAGTTRGLAYSSDHGRTWSYVRGSDWAELANGSYIPPTPTVVPSRTPLNEDWICCLAGGSGNSIWLGYRAKGYEALRLPKLTSAHTTRTGLVRVLVPLPDNQIMVGTYGKGVSIVPDPTGDSAAPPAAVAGNTDFPSSAKPADAAQLRTMSRKLAALPAATSSIENLDDDWMSKGDWVGRYGRQFAYLTQWNWGNQGTGRRDIEVDFTTGPFRPKANVYMFNSDLKSIQFPENVLYSPTEHARVQGEYNDGTFNTQYPLTMEGPDLYASVSLPSGNHRVSIYFFNKDGRRGKNVYRDYYIQAKALANDPVQEGIGTDKSGMDAINAELSPTAARQRVPLFWNGVYKRFLVRGGGTFWFKIGRNHSYVTMAQGVFIDSEDASNASDVTPTTLPQQDNLVAAIQLWNDLNAAAGKEGYGAFAGPMRLAAYRAADAAGADPNLLANWRRQMGLWSADDRMQLEQQLGITVADENDRGI